MRNFVGWVIPSYNCAIDAVVMEKTAKSIMIILFIAFYLITVVSFKVLESMPDASMETSDPVIIRGILPLRFP